MTTSLTRLASANTYDTALTNLNNRQSNLSNLQSSLTSGKKITVASDDPTGAAQAERALTRISRIATDQRALESQRNSITQAESTLGDVTSALQNFRDLVVSAGNGTFSAAERTTVAVQLTGLRDQILALSNKTDSNGQPLFGALGSAAKPFTGPQSTTQDYTFQGLPGQTSSSENSIPTTLNGDSAFMLQENRDGAYNVSMSTIPTTRQLQTSTVSANPPGTPVAGASYAISIDSLDTTTTPGTTTAAYTVTESPSGTTYAGSGSYATGKPASITVTEMPGLSLTITGAPAVGDTVNVKPTTSLFSVLDNAIRDIGSAANANAATQAVTQALGNIDIGMSRVSAVRGQAGDLLNRADVITADNSNKSIQREADRSRAEDLDMTKGISDFSIAQTGYQAALQSYAQIQKLSLFNYIG